MVLSGEAEYEPLSMVRLEGDIILLTPGHNDTLAKLKEWDALLFDNNNFLAVQTYHRHQVPGKEYAVWDQFRDDNGEPLYPQRPCS